MPIFPKPIDLAANYVWTGDHTFDGVVTCNGDFNAVDGSFTGNLVNEVGGSYKLYNLGDESATDQEYYETSWDSNTLKMFAKATGAGVLRSIQFGSDSVQIDAKNATDQIVFRTDGTYRMQVNNTSVTATVPVIPSTNGTINLGNSVTNRWANVFAINGNFTGDVASVNGSFSGNITAENLPTSDPGVPGQFYVTTGGALKVSQ